MTSARRRRLHGAAPSMSKGCRRPMSARCAALQFVLVLDTLGKSAYEYRGRVSMRSALRVYIWLRPQCRFASDSAFLRFR